MGEWLERHRGYVLSGLTAIVVAGVALLWVNRPQSHPIVISTPVPTATLTPAPVRVYVTGAVKQPDVYTLPPGSILRDAILAAGGATADADLNRVNLALQLYDQQQVYVPRQGEGTPPVSMPNPAPPPGTRTAAKVNINTATVQELDTLPGIGPAIAQRIVDYRTENGRFATIEDIMQVKGIGPALFADLKDLIAVQ